MLEERKEQVDKELQADLKQFHSLTTIAFAIEKNPKEVIFYMIKKKTLGCSHVRTQESFNA